MTAKVPHLRNGKYCVKDMPEDAELALHLWMVDHKEDVAEVLKPYGISPEIVGRPTFYIACTEEHDD